MRAWKYSAGAVMAFIAVAASGAAAQAFQESPPAAPSAAVIFQHGQLNLRELLRAGGLVGYLTIGLSIGMVALIVEQLLTTRRAVLIPRQAPEEFHALIVAGKFREAETMAREHPSFLGFLIATGLKDADLGYEAVEKAMEDAAVEQSARLLRKVEYLAVIGAVAPMLGLMGTVWGMIQAFAEFAERANPSPADFAPSISVALVTTFFGLIVAVPAISFFAFFRNRVDELSAEAAITAGHIMAPLKRTGVARAKTPAARPAADPARPQVPPVVSEREPRR